MGWLGTWANRLQIDIADTNIDGDLTDFPVLLYLSTSSGTGAYDLSVIFDELGSDANRKKIAVTTSDGTTQCYVEIAYWNDASEVAELWVKVPSILASGGAQLYIYYDVLQADNTTYVGDPKSAAGQAVWDSYFKAVYHLTEDPNGDPAGGIFDSTSYGNHGTPAGSMTSADLVDGVVAGKSIEFDGSNDYINIGTDASIALGAADHTIEAFGRWSSGYNAAGIVALGHSSFTEYGLTLGYNNSSLAGYIVGTKWFYNWGSGLNNSVWHHICGTWKQSTTTPVCYADGVSKSYSGPGGANAGLYNAIGEGYNGLKFIGRIDEVRISSIVRPAEWVKATYYTTKDLLVAYSVDPNVSLSSNALLTITLSNFGSVVTDVFVVATALNVPVTIYGVDAFTLDLVATAINISLSAIGGYNGGAVMRSLDTIDISFLLIGPSINWEIPEGWIRFKDALPWDLDEQGNKYTGYGHWHKNGNPSEAQDWTLVEQENKWGYLNNPRWASQEAVQTFLTTVGLPTGPDAKHMPCGHWHKEKPVRQAINVITDVTCFDLDYFYPDLYPSYNTVVHVSGNVYVVCHAFGGTGSYIRTFTVDEDGYFGAVIDSWKFDADINSTVSKILKVNGSTNIFVIHTQVSNTTLQTLEINDDGTIEKVIIDKYTTWGFSGVNPQSFCHVTGATYAYTHGGYVDIIGIDPSGLIDAAAIASVACETQYNTAYCPGIVKVTDGLYIYFAYQGFVQYHYAMNSYTLAITASTITLIEKLNLNPEEVHCDQGSHRVTSCYEAGFNGIIYAYNKVNLETYIRTVQISPAGAFQGLVDRIVIDPLGTHPSTIYIGDSYFLQAGYGATYQYKVNSQGYFVEVTRRCDAMAYNAFQDLIECPNTTDRVFLLVYLEMHTIGAETYYNGVVITFKPTYETGSVFQDIDLKDDEPVVWPMDFKFKGLP